MSALTRPWYTKHSPPSMWPLLFQINVVEPWIKRNDPERALEDRLFWDKLSWASFLNAVCVVPCPAP